MKGSLPKGLVLIENFITPEEEYDLLKHIDASPWNTSIKRRTQHYGYEYNYTDKNAKKADLIPEWCQFLITRLLEQGLLKQNPDQMIVNEYLPVQGIAGHTDSVHLFADGIVSISLGSDINMEFSRYVSPTILEIPLPKCSALILHGEARYKWRHGIAARKHDNGKKRERRVSITFRKMK